ncbi:hypothetical protein FANTH_7801 [Fusarium anthophilum]|uniref:Uncharacterized protein n=1 Tax=Fusarium anthophilum TaxID=48485 RepID=A0A8H4ZE05_9HYPO|nr:hypothetical protein FANTH_7801 [Fusarium anthophilum]
MLARTAAPIVRSDPDPDPEPPPVRRELNRHQEPAPLDQQILNNLGPAVPNQQLRFTSATSAALRLLKVACKNYRSSDDDSLSDTNHGRIDRYRANTPDNALWTKPCTIFVQ